jgi:hypothetical protein
MNNINLAKAVSTLKILRADNKLLMKFLKDLNKEIIQMISRSSISESSLKLVKITKEFFILKPYLILKLGIIC